MENLTKKEFNAIGLAVSAIYFADSSDYLSYLWQIVKAIGGEEACNLLEEDESAAMDKYRPDLQDQEKIL